MHLAVLKPLNVAHALEYVDVVRSGLLRQASSHGHLQGVLVAVLGGHQLGKVRMVLHRRNLGSALASISVVDILVGDEIILVIWVELVLQAHVDILRLVLGALEIMLELILSRSVTRGCINALGSFVIELAALMLISNLRLQLNAALALVLL